MMTARYHSEALRKLFYEQKIATMDQLKKALGTNVDVTVFRKLKELSYCSSYSHRGRYYTLKEIAVFDELGLWCYRSVWFSKYGTLLQTAQALVETSEAGYYTSELGSILHVRVKDALRTLAKRGSLIRKQVSGKWLYCASDSRRCKQQLLARRLTGGVNGISDQAEVLSNELKAAIIIFFSLLDEKQRRLYAGLESFKWGHGGDRRIASLLGLDEKTVARGRKELLTGDFEPKQVRKSGGGRKPLKKGLQK